MSKSPGQTHGSIHPKGIKLFAQSFPQKKRKFLEKLPLKKLIYSSVLVNISILLTLWLVSNKLPPEVPLFYGLPAGRDQLAPSSTLVLPTIFSFFIVLINLLAATITEDTFLKKSLVVSGFMLSLFSAITTLKIIFLVGSL